jgi:mRNA interferase MazF
VEGLVKGDVVVLSYPFSDFSQTNRRPALVVAILPGDDVVVCQITSQTVRDANAILIEQTDFAEGKLSQPSNIRPGRLFTADKNIILYRVGRITTDKLSEAIATIVNVIRS